jgi:4-amino-4-deoxy-L-arabinose transferase-like glycosyltransferase
MTVVKHPMHVRLVKGVIIGALAALIAAVMILASVPPVDRDALTHHLAVPKMYLKHGGIYEIPYVPFSYYPMNLDLLYMIPLYFGNDTFPKYIHFSFALLTAGLIISFLYRRLSDLTAALLGGLLFLSLPVIVKLSITVYVDLGLIFFSTASLLQLLRWAETDFRLKHLVLAAVFAGLCLGTKPNGVLSILFLVSIIPFLLRSGTESKSPPCHGGRCEHCPKSMFLRPLGWSTVFALIAMVIYSPWMLRNYVWTGNPIYPMGQSVFASNAPLNSKTIAMSRDRADGIESAENLEESRSGFGHFVARKMIFGETLLETLSIPLRIFFQGQDDNPRLFDGRLNPYLIVFPLLTFLPIKGRRRSAHIQMETRLLGAFSLLYLLFAFFLVDMRIRYIAPIIPPLVILAVIGIYDLIGIITSRFSLLPKRMALIVTGGVLFGLLGLNAVYFVGQFGIVDPMSYLQGKLSREEYIQKYRPEYEAISFANRNLPEASRILALFNGNRIYYSERELICDNESFRNDVQSSRAPADLAQILKRKGISHLLVRLDLFNQWAGSQFNVDQITVLKSFFDEALTRLYHGHGYALFAVTAG